MANYQKQREALNVTTTGYRSFTKEFLKNVDTLHRFEFSDRMSVNALIDQKDLDLRTSALCKISCLWVSEELDIVREIRKFMQESRKSLRSFLYDDKDEFGRYRDHALNHLQNCTKACEDLATTCEWSGEYEESTRTVIQEIADQSRRVSKLLQNLQRVAESSLGGTCQIFSDYGPVDTYDYCLVSPFVHYVNVMLMCTTVINRKSGVLARVKSFFKPNTDKLPHFSKEPKLLMEAYHLARYFNNKAQHKREVEMILQNKCLSISDNNVVKEFKHFVVNIDLFLAKKFDINIYEQYESKQEQLSQKYFKLEELMIEYRAVKKELQEKLNLWKKQIDEIANVHFEFSKKLSETEQKWRENIYKYKKNNNGVTYYTFDNHNNVIGRNKGTNCNMASMNETCNYAKNDSPEIKFIKILEENKTNSENLLDCLAEYTQKVSGFENHESSKKDHEERKSYRENLSDGQFKLKESKTAYEEVERNVHQNLIFHVKVKKECWKEDIKFFEKIQKAEQECQKSILKCKSTRKDIAKLIENGNKKRNR